MARQMAIMFPEIEVTDDDIRRYEYHTRGSIYGIKLLRALDSDILRKAVDRKNPEHAEITEKMGSKTNPTWIEHQAAEELYDRGEIDEIEFDAITR